MPLLATERMVIDYVRATDGEDIYRYYHRNQSHLEPWKPLRPEGYHSADAWRTRAKQQAAFCRDGASYHFVVRVPHRAEIATVCNLSNVVRGAFLGCRLGYSLDHEIQGSGIMGEALSAIIRFVFDEPELHRIMANYMPKNQRSARLRERMGFEKEGLARDYLCIAGQ